MASGSGSAEPTAWATAPGWPAFRRLTRHATFMDTCFRHTDAAPLPAFVRKNNKTPMTTRPDATNETERSADEPGQRLNASGFRMLEDIARELAGEVVFPTYFDAAFRLRQELQDPQLPTARIATIVSAEPLVATKLMRLANSAFHRRRGSKPADDLKAAIGRLGIDQVRSIALAVTMGQLLRSKDLVSFGDFSRELWMHSIRAAAAARSVARARTPINPEQALLAGLVHDLGAFYMLYRAVQYLDLRAQPDSVRGLIAQWHESIGVTLLKALGMPDAIVQATIDHDQLRPVPNPVRTLADVVYVANIIAAAQFEWLHQHFDADDGQAAIVRRDYADLLPEIDNDTLEMQAIFS